MNRRLILLLIIFVLAILNNYQASSQRKFIKNKPVQNDFKDKEFIFGISYTGENNSAFYNSNGDLKTVLPDTLLDTTRKVMVPREYSMEFVKSTINIDAQWNFTKDFELNFAMPISFYSYTETYHTYFDIDTNVNYTFEYDKFDRAHFNLTRIDYFKLGLNYKMFDDYFYGTVIGAIKLPSGSHKGQLDDTLNYPILSDGELESLIGFSGGFHDKKWRMETEMLYNGRTEDFSNQLLFNVRLGITTVPGTLLHINFNAAKTLGDIKDSLVFDPRREILAEDYLKLKFGLIFWFDDNAGFDAEYGATLLGKNSWSSSRYVFRLFIGI